MIIKRRKILILIVLAGLAGGGFLAWRTFGKGKQEPAYSTAQVKKGRIISTVSASGALLQTNAFTVTKEVTGVVKEVFVKDGEEVEKGQKLVEVTLDQSGEQAQLKAWISYLSAKTAAASAEESKLSLGKGVEDAKNKLATAQRDFDADWGSTEYWDAERRKRLSDLKSAEISLELAKQKYERADEAIGKAELDLNSAWMSYQLASPIITAPRSGKVFDISVAAGMLVSLSDQKILTIVGEQKLLLSVSVNEIDIGKIVSDQKATVTFDAVSGKTFTGKVVGVDRTGTQTQSVVSYPVLIQLDTSHEPLLPNMTAAAEIVTAAKENVLWVPPSAVRTRAKQTGVQVLVNGRLEEKPVEIGLETPGQVEIVSGLSEGETVIVGEQTAGGRAPSFGGQGGFRMMMR